ncbi:MAG: restriction endonuclease subunit S (plasmid) [Candidatus Methanoperedens sp.]|nr:MAG: restriction endonuclease subunit S [Candidatus Methanoperedens sp.]
MKTVEGWKTTPLPLLLRLLKSGGTPDTSHSNYYGGDIPFVTIEDMTASSRHLTSTIKALTDEGLKHSNAWLVPANSILYSIYATLGLPRINTVPVTTNQAILALINDPNKIDRDYLYYWFEYIRASVVNFSSQTTQSNLSATTVKTFLVDHPTDLSEQTKIAEVLSTVDRAIEQTEALIAKQQRIKTGLMQDLFTRGIDEHGNLRSEQTHNFKDSPLGRIPVGWDVKPLGTICELIKDGTHLPPARVAEGPLLLGVQNMVDGKLTKTSSDTRVPWDFYEQMHQNWKIQTDDVFLAIVGATIGKTCLAPSNFEPYTLQRSVALIRGKKGILHNRFLLQYLKSPFFQSIIHTKTNSTAQAGLYLSQIADFHFPVCPIEEQIAISSKLEEISNLVESYQRTGGKLHSLKTALMQDLLTGKKRVMMLLNKEVIG